MVYAVYSAINTYFYSLKGIKTHRAMAVDLEL